MGTAWTTLTLPWCGCGQAQECVFEKAVNDHKSPAILARWGAARGPWVAPMPDSASCHLPARRAALGLLLPRLRAEELQGGSQVWGASAASHGAGVGGRGRIAIQAAALYKDVLLALQQPPLAAYLDKSWTVHATAKAGIYDAQALLSSGDAFHAEDQVASEIARLRVSPPPLPPAASSFCLAAAACTDLLCSFCDALVVYKD